MGWDRNGKPEILIGLWPITLGPKGQRATSLLPTRVIGFAPRNDKRTYYPAILWFPFFKRLHGNRTERGVDLKAAFEKTYPRRKIFRAHTLHGSFVRVKKEWISFYSKSTIRDGNHGYAGKGCDNIHPEKLTRFPGGFSDETKFR